MTTPPGTTPDVFATGRRVGAHRWWELSAFELLGSWAARASDPAAKVLLDAHSGHAAWRAEQWADRLPRLAGVEHAELVQAPDPHAKEAVAVMRGLGHDLADQPVQLDVLMLAAAYRVLLPRRAAAYEAHRATASSVAEPAVVRTLGHVAPDVAEDWAAGEERLQALLMDRQLAGVAAGCVAGLDSVFAGVREPAAGTVET